MLNSDQNLRFLALCEIRWMTLEAIGHLSYASLSIVHHSVAILEFKLELQSGNAQSGSKLEILSRVTLKIRCVTMENNRAQ